MFRILVEEKSFVSNHDKKLTVLKDINFTLKDHEFISIIGPSGCGKTTLIRIIAGFDEDFRGKLEIMDDNGKFRRFKPLGNVGYIPQQFSLFPWKNVENNIRFALKSRNLTESEKDKIVNDLLELVNMNEFRHYYPKQISGGMQQKIAICRALASSPISNLIVMDEPFSALDAQTRNKIQGDLLDIWRKKNLTIIFITHNIDEAIFMSDRILVMDGKHPSRIVDEIDITLPHPRERTSVEFNQIRKDLLEKLK